MMVDRLKRVPGVSIDRVATTAGAIPAELQLDVHSKPTMFSPDDVHVAGLDDLQKIVDLLEESAAWMLTIGITRWQPGCFTASQDQLKAAIATGTVYVWKVS